MKLKLKLKLLATGVLALCALLFTSCVTTNEHEAGIGPSFKGPLGIELYSVRAQMKKSVPAALDEVQKLGFKNAEIAGMYNVPPAKFRDELLQRGITPISAHFDFGLFKNHLDDVVSNSEALGLKYVGCAWIPHGKKFDEKSCDEAIKVFNHAGQTLAQHGIKFFYHTHGYEFEPDGDGTLFDKLMAGTDPKYVSYEMDIFWIVYPGQDPVKLLHKYSGRWDLMHLKDMDKSLRTGSLSGHVDVKYDVAMGDGQMDIPAILKAAKEVGVKWYFIEDESPNSEEQMPRSLKYLETVKF